MSLVGGVPQSWLLSRAQRKEAFVATVQFDHRKHLLCTSLIGMELAALRGTVLQQLQHIRYLQRPDEGEQQL
jgi:hypothetical protein